LTEQSRIEQAAKEAFKALRAKAQRAHGGNTQPLLVVDAVECFLRRLAMSEHAERDEYEGVRCKQVAALGRARISFALDCSFGDPDGSTVISLESVIDQPDVRLQAYPLALNLAEKIVTAMQRREVSTRDRDFADLWVTSRRHRIDARELRGHVLTVAGHRGQELISMAEALQNMPDRQQSYAAMVERMSYLAPPPERWTDLIDGVIGFVDPLLDDGDGRLSQWDPDRLEWAATGPHPRAAGRARAESARVPGHDWVP
jgi:Nucleotidyl transferase AbiEii toxin, Type IV TA system